MYATLGMRAELIPKMCANLLKKEKSWSVPYLDLGECEDQITCVIGLTMWMNRSWEWLVCHLGWNNYMRIGSNILRYEDGQYSVNTGMGIFYTHIFVNIYVKKKTKWGYWKISWFGEVVKSGHIRGNPDMGFIWDHYIHQDMSEADLDSETELSTREKAKIKHYQEAHWGCWKM